MGENIRRVFADIRPQMLEKVIENWTSRLDYIRSSRGSHMPEWSFYLVTNPWILDSVLGFPSTLVTFAESRKRKPFDLLWCPITAKRAIKSPQIHLTQQATSSNPLDEATKLVTLT
ncbi:hypothetical protein TNCV_4774261 [Trichonephila clavipes]|nr:hypothetical protein TNCV_4774261 [Trichonephila clavipes]